MDDVFIIKGCTPRTRLEIEKDGVYTADMSALPRIDGMVITKAGDALCIGAGSDIKKYTVRIVSGEPSSLGWAVTDPMSAVKGSYEIRGVCADEMRLTRVDGGFMVDMIVPETEAMSDEPYTAEDLEGDKAADVAMLDGYGETDLTRRIADASSREELLMLEKELCAVIDAAYADIIRHRSE